MPDIATDDLDELIVSRNLPKGSENSLLAKVSGAQDALARGNSEAATNKLNALINEFTAQSGKKIPQTDADMLIAIIENILANLT